MQAEVRRKLEWLRGRAREERRLRALGERVRRLDARTLISLGCMLLGALLLVYVGWSYGSMYLEQRALAQEWQQQQQSALFQSTVKTADAQAQPANYTLTRLTVPKISLDAIVVEGTDNHALKLGPGHLENSALPGADGNAVISGHRDTFFRHIHELEKGDQVLVERGGRIYKYEVTGKKIVDPNATWVTDPTKDSELTLITCYPTYYIGPAPNRLVVFTKLVGEQPETGAVKTAAAAAP